MKVLGNPWFATVVTLLPGLALAFGGYANIWPLFGASNQLLGGMTMITLAVFCKCTGRKGWMLYVPVVFLLCCTFTSLVQSAMGCMTAVQAYGFFGTIPATATTAAVSVAATKGLQLVFARSPSGPRWARPSTVAPLPLRLLPTPRPLRRNRPYESNVTSI